MADVSILVPVYCRTEEAVSWLIECLSSAFNQGELVVVDDGSPLQTEVFEAIEYCKVRQFIRLDRNTGVSHARNVAAANASHDLILPLDCDDRLAPNAVERLLSVWDGETPVYSDVSKFGEETVPHFTLLDFMCEHIVKHVGFSSVNVLHLKDQWRQIGGWNEALEFYEDGEYNARLFTQWCGKRIPEPLVEYRIHPDQRTKQYKQRSASIARQILSMTRRLPMGCKSCGGTRTGFSNQSAAPTAPPTTDINSLPGEVGGRILAQYIGGQGMARHYYNGIVTKFPYKVTYGDYVYVDPQDAREASDTANIKMFIRIHKPEAPAVAVQKVVSTTNDAELMDLAKMPNREPREAPQRQPVEYPDINTMSVRQIMALDVVDENVVRYMLAAEQRGKNRSKVIEHLNALLK